MKKTITWIEFPTTQVFTSTGDYWRLLEITRDYHRLVENTNDYQRLLEITGDYRRLLEITGDYKEWLWVTANYWKLHESIVARGSSLLLGLLLSLVLIPN